MWKYLNKVLYVVSVSQKQLYLLLLFFVIASIFEAFGVSLIGPFLALVTKPSLVFENPISAGIYKFFGAQSDRQVVLLSGCVLIGLYLLKTIIYFVSRYWIIRYSLLQKHLLEVRLIDSYLRVPYVFHLNRNSNDLTENIVIGSYQFSFNCLIPLLDMISNAVVAIALIALLAKTDILFFLLTVAIILPTALLVIFIGKLQKKWGGFETVAQKGIMKAVSHALGGLKETKVIGCENFFQDDLKNYSQDFFFASTKNNTAHWLPRVVLEGLLLILVVVYILVSYLYRGAGITELASVMGVFAAASIRLIPAASQMSQAFGRLQASSYVVNLLYSDLKQIEENKAQFSKHQTDTSRLQHSRFEQAVTLQNIGYGYPNSQRLAIDGISLVIKKGQAVGLVGRSGSGKTTLVDILLGLLFPQQGDILVDGQSIYDDMPRWQSLLGYIPQTIFLTDDTIKRNVAYGVSPELIDDDKVYAAIQAAQLDELVKSLPEGIDTPVGERGVRLSGGQRQRIGIARALYHNCEILILDEATSALDSETETLISDAIHSLVGTKTLIIIAHRYSTIESCDVIYRLEQGKLAGSGSYEEVILAET
jgi:ABC-type multidrug transport system fused ATPase/permease subunit